MSAISSPCELPVTPRRWFILEVMPTKEEGDDWTALLIDIDPDAFCAGQTWHIKNQSCYLHLGVHMDRDEAWDHCEGLLATRH
jgi:hypothetical protein